MKPGRLNPPIIKHGGGVAASDSNGSCLRMWVVGLVFILVTFPCSKAFAAESTLTASGSATDPAIVVGFVGGFVHCNDVRHSEVQLAEKLRAGYEGRAHVAIFENRHREVAHRAILKWLDRDGDGELSIPEKQRAHIILYGHSWGGSTVVALSRELQKEGIPVLLTIQVDSIAKPGRNDRVIPSNVIRAVNFYQTRGVLHGLPEIMAADPSRTEILGDFRFDYKSEPAPCSVYPWFARHFLKGHVSIECDPELWHRIEALISEYLPLPEVPSSTAISRKF